MNLMLLVYTMAFSFCFVRYVVAAFVFLFLVALQNGMAYVIDAATVDMEDLELVDSPLAAAFNLWSGAALAVAWLAVQVGRLSGGQAALWRRCAQVSSRCLRVGFCMILI